MLLITVIAGICCNQQANDSLYYDMTIFCTAIADNEVPRYFVHRLNQKIGLTVLIKGN